MPDGIPPRHSQAPDHLEEEQTGQERREREKSEGDDADLTELAVPAPADRSYHRAVTLESQQRKARGEQAASARNSDENAFLSENAEPPPVEREQQSSTDEEKAAELGDTSSPSLMHDDEDEAGAFTDGDSPPSPFLTQLYIISHLIFFSLLGTLSRVGLQAINQYPSAPFSSSVLWANLGGSLFMGFLAEDRRIFREEWGNPSSEEWSFHPSKTSSEDALVRDSVKASHGKVKKTIPLFIGLATGYCGSFTSFSSFLRDAFLALTNDLPSPTPGGSPPIPPRNGGYSFEATIAILAIHVTVSLSALKLGAHLAVALDPYMPTLPFKLIRRFLDPLVVLLGCGGWIGAILLSIWPPADNWRGRATFSLVFAPLGCLHRFYASKHLNARLPAFPLGTFFTNIVGTVIEGVAYDLQHARGIGAGEGEGASASTSAVIVSCQVLQGVMDGFCGCATTVSTWVAELTALKTRNAYVYGLGSVATALAFLVVIMGSMGWTADRESGGGGFAKPACST